MKNPEDQLTRAERNTILTSKAVGWILMAVIVWKGGQAVWTIFCSIDFNPILRP